MIRQTLAKNNMSIFALILFFLSAPKLKDPESLLDISSALQLICYSEEFKAQNPHAKTLEDIRQLVSGRYVNADSEMTAEDLNQFLANLEAKQAGVVYKMGFRTLPMIPHKQAKIYRSGSGLCTMGDLVVFGGRFDGITATHRKALETIKNNISKKYRRALLVVVITADDETDDEILAPSVKRKKKSRNKKHTQNQQDRALALKTIPHVDIVIAMLDSESQDYFRIIRDTRARECVVCEGDYKTLNHCLRHCQALKEKDEAAPKITILPRIPEN